MELKIFININFCFSNCIIDIELDRKIQRYIWNCFCNLIRHINIQFNSLRHLNFVYTFITRYNSLVSSRVLANWLPNAHNAIHDLNTRSNNTKKPSYTRIVAEVSLRSFTRWSYGRYVVEGINRFGKVMVYEREKGWK